jgi:predicted ATP-grasp superfamily ATP-dependent carboligase
MAESAARAGLTIFAADLFGDRDLLRVATLFRHALPYPAAVPERVAGFPPAPWLFTGALENYPEILAALALRRRPLGASVPAIRAVRDPRQLREIAHQAGLQFPETLSIPTGLPVNGTWLRKPLASAGGHGVSVWLGWHPEDHSSQGWQWQQRVAGRSWSAAFVITSAGAIVLGMSRQLIGRAWTGARPFHWCGGLDLPVDTLPDHIMQSLVRLGRGLAAVPGLVGLIGVDFILDRAARLHLIEINPRPTASMELIERGTGISLVAAQLAACGDPLARVGDPLSGKSRPWLREAVWSKAILFASRPLPIDDRAVELLDATAGPWTDHDGWPAVADLPTPPQTIARGRPICSVFASGPTAPVALETLIRRTTALSRALLP